MWELRESTLLAKAMNAPSHLGGARERDDTIAGCSYNYTRGIVDAVQFKGETQNEQIDLPSILLSLKRAEGIDPRPR